MPSPLPLSLPIPNLFTSFNAMHLQCFGHEKYPVSTIYFVESLVVASFISELHIFFYFFSHPSLCSMRIASLLSDLQLVMVFAVVAVVVCFIFCSFSFICFNLFHFRTFSRVLLFLSSFYLFSIVSCRVILFFSLYSFFLSLYFVSCLVFSVSSVTYGSTSSSSYCTLNKYFASG